MIAGKQVLALIPARSGSKGLPGKNTRIFHGKPLIEWSVLAAKQCGFVDRVIVSTDTEAIAEFARATGAEIPFLRPEALAGDTTPMFDVVQHLLEQLHARKNWRPEIILLLQPTSPLRTAADLRAAAHLLTPETDGVISVAPVKQHPQWLQRLGPQKELTPFLDEPPAELRQQLEPLYALNGAIYLVRTEAFLREKTFRPRRVRGYVMPPERSVDIDAELDWQIAEHLFAPC